MKKLLTLSIVVLLGVALAGPALAGSGKTVTLEGKVLCAKCSLHEQGQDHCQNVLVVEKKKGKQKHFYLTKNETYEHFGEVCKDARSVRVTGQIMKEDGRKWLVASEITPIGDKG